MKRLLTHLAALAGYLLITLYFCRPVGAHLATRLLGPGGDASVTLWNMWHFRYALKELHANPFWTELQYWPIGGNLLMHQYTLFCDLLAFPFIQRYGLIAIYNAHMLLSLALGGYLLFLFARDWGRSPAASFVAGAALAFAPFIGAVIDSGDGVCYQVLWPAVLFVWMLCRTARDGRPRDAAFAAVALTIQWAYSYYYFIYCVILGPVFYLAKERPLLPTFAKRGAPPELTRPLNAACLLALAWAAASAARGQRQFHGQGGPAQILRYALPYLALWALLAARLLAGWRVSLRRDPAALRPRLLLRYAGPYLAWALLNVPLIVAVLRSMASGDYGSAASPWRGGGMPTELFDLLLPDTSHPLWGGALRALYATARLPARLQPAIGVAPLALAAWLWRRTCDPTHPPTDRSTAALPRRRQRDPWLSLWFAAFAFSFVFALGPWLKVYGVHTYLPLPFYFFHLLPVLDNMQHGLRFIAFANLFLALLLAYAIDRLRERPRARRWAAAAVFALLAAEFWPPPRALWALNAPPILERLGRRPDGALLTVPVGANFNGIRSAGWRGRFPLDLAHQPIHRKPVVGGYLARVPRRAYRAFVDNPLIADILVAQDGGPLSDALRDGRRCARLLREIRIRYVLVNKDQVPEQLAAAIARWPLTRLDADGPWVLYEMTAQAAKR